MKSYFWIILLLLMSGCTPAGLASWLNPSAENAKISSLKFTDGSVAVNEALQEEEYQRALDLLIRLEKEGRAEGLQTIQWSRSVDGVLQLAEQNLKRKNFVSAGQLYRKVLMNLPQKTELLQAVTLNATQINSRIDQCADYLLARGLRAYRLGDLREALEIWTEINSFHPSHKASQNAIHTTRLQLQNLQSLPSRT